MKLKTLGAGLLVVVGLSACEVAPSFDPANYYPAARYSEAPLVTEAEFWNVRRKAAED